MKEEISDLKIEKKIEYSIECMVREYLSGDIAMSRHYEKQMRELIAGRSARKIESMEKEIF